MNLPLETATMRDGTDEVWCHSPYKNILVLSQRWNIERVKPCSFDQPKVRAREGKC